MPFRSDVPRCSEIFSERYEFREKERERETRRDAIPSHGFPADETVLQRRRLAERESEEEVKEEREKGEGDIAGEAWK